MCGQYNHPLPWSGPMLFKSSRQRVSLKYSLYMLKSTQIGKIILKHAKTRPKKTCNYSASATCVIQEMSARNRTWNLFPGKVNQQYPHTKVNQHVLTEKVPKNTNKNQIPSLRNQLSNHVQSVASPQYKHQ